VCGLDTASSSALKNYACMPRVPLAGTIVPSARRTSGLTSAMRLAVYDTLYCCSSDPARFLTWAGLCVMIRRIFLTEVWIRRRRYPLWETRLRRRTTQSGIRPMASRELHVYFGVGTKLVFSTSCAATRKILHGSGQGMWGGRSRGTRVQCGTEKS
jgi:hypothetical protein